MPFDPDAFLAGSSPSEKGPSTFDPYQFLAGEAPPTQPRTFMESAVGLAKQFPAGIARGMMSKDLVAPLGEAQLAMENLTSLPAPKVSDYAPAAEQALPEAKTPGERIVSAAGEALPLMAAFGPTLPNLAVAGVGAGSGQAAVEATRGVVPEWLARGAGDIVGGLGAAALPRLGMAGLRAAGVLAPKTEIPAEVGRALLRDQDTSEALLRRLEMARQVRPDATLADVGGENVRGIVERLAQTPGESRSIVTPALEQRQKQQMNRIVNDLTTATGARRSAYRAIEDTMAERTAAATPLYTRAYEDGDRAIWSSELERLSGAPYVQSAMRKAVATWQNTAIADGYGAMNPGAMVDRGGILDIRGGRIPAFPNIQFWDYTKRMLDDMIAGAVGKKPAKAATLTRLKNQLTAVLDRDVPSYRAARDSWSGRSRYMEAIEQGKGILDRNITAEELRANLEGMTEAEREGHLIGAISAIRNKMGNDPAKMADMTKYIRSPEMRAKLAALMPTPEAAEAFNRALDYEIGSSVLVGQSLRGSPTARRKALQEDATQMMGELVAHGLGHGSFHSFGVARRLWHLLGKPIRDTLRSRSDAMTAELLTSTKQTAEVAPRITPRPARAPISARIPATIPGMLERDKNRAYGGRISSIERAARRREI